MTLKALYQCFAPLLESIPQALGGRRQAQAQVLFTEQRGHPERAMFGQLQFQLGAPGVFLVLVVVVFNESTVSLNRHLTKETSKMIEWP